MSFITAPLNFLGYILNNYLFSFILNLCVIIMLSSVFLSIINNSLFNLPEMETVNKITIDKKLDTLLQIDILKHEILKKLPEPTDSISYENSIKYQGEYQFNPLNPKLSKFKPNDSIIIPLGQSGFLLSTVIPEKSDALFELNK